MSRIVLWEPQKIIDVFLKVIMYVKFIKSKWHFSFKEDWDWAPAWTMKLKKDLEDRKETVRGRPLVFTNFETRKEK
jgi:hypothetical protein